MKILYPCFPLRNCLKYKLVAVVLIIFYFTGSAFPVYYAATKWPDKTYPEQNYSSVINELKITAWDILPFNDVSSFQTFILTGAAIQLKTSRVITATYVSVKSVPHLSNGTNTKEYSFKLNEPVNSNEIGKIGLQGTGTVEGFKVAGISAAGMVPLYYMPSYSNMRLPVVLQDREITWLSSYNRTNSFVDREVSFNITFATDVPANAWITCEVELTDGDILRFTRKGPFTRNSSLKISVPAPYTLQAEHIASVGMFYAKPVLAFRKLDGKKLYSFIEYSYNDDMSFNMKDMKLSYSEVGPGILKGYEIFSRDGLIRTGGASYRKKKISPTTTTEALLFQFVTGKDDLRVHTKYRDYASEINGELLLLGVPQKISGYDVTGNIPYSLTPDCCPWDQIGYLMQGEQGASGNAWAYLSLDEQIILRKNIPFLRLYHVDPNNMNKTNPFGSNKMASAVIPVSDCRIAFAHRFTLEPRLGRAQTGAELVNRRGTFAMDDDKWDCKEVIISYWTDQGWRRLLSSAVDLETFQRNGTRLTHRLKTIDVYKYIEKGPEYELAPMKEPVSNQVIYEPCKCRETGADKQVRYPVSINRSGSRDVNCGFQFNITCTDTIRFNSGFNPCAGDCPFSFSGRLTKGNSLMKSYSSFRFADEYLVFPKPGSYTLELNPRCQDKTCTPCRFYFTVKDIGCVR